MDDINKQRVSEFNRGNQDALNAIFNDFYRPLYFFAQKIILNEKEAEDIVTETIMKLWELRSNFETYTKIKSFLYITAKNACLNYLKQSQRVNSRHLTYIYLQPGHEDSILSEITQAEVLREIYGALHNLPPQCRKIMQMSFIEGKKNHEIAKQLGLSLNTIKNQKTRGMEIMRSKILKANLLYLIVFYSLTRGSSS
jgi:RNA polymerase sigma-70 factor (family 1)